MSRYEQMLDLWESLGGQRHDRSGPAWTWRPDPSPDDLRKLLSYPPAFDDDSPATEANMAVVNHPNPPYLDADGNADWPDPEPEWQMEALGNGRSISRGFGGCATCDGGGCRDCT